MGLLLLWIFPNLETQTVLFRAISFCALLGGLGRFISVAVVGMPSTPLIVFTLIEVIDVACFIDCQNLVAKFG